MKIDNDQIQVAVTNRDAAGNKIEPEEAPARRLMTVGDAYVKHGDQIIAARPDVSIAYEATAGEFATNVRHACAGCKFFNVDRWHRTMKAWESSADVSVRSQLNGIRAALIESQNVRLVDAHASAEGDIDVDHAMQHMGLCDAMTEMYKEAVVVHPMGGCPPTDDKGAPMPLMFKPRDSQAARDGGKNYDKIIQLSRGSRK